MRAVDTNVLLRYFSDDDPIQSPLARQVLAQGGLFVARTVVLEFEWVMRGFYRADPEDFCRAVEHLLGMPHVTVERWEALQDAVQLHRQGLDFSDALHWTCSATCERLVTFDDRKFARRARRLRLVPEVTLPFAA